MNALAAFDEINPVGKIGRHQHADDGLAHGRFMIHAVLLTGRVVKCEQIILVILRQWPPIRAGGGGSVVVAGWDDQGEGGTECGGEDDEKPDFCFGVHSCPPSK